MYVPTNPSGKPSAVERWLMKSAVIYAARRLTEMDALKGKKTYLIMAVIAVLGGLKALGYIDDGLYMMLIGILAPAGVMALRAGMNATPPTP